MRRWQRSTIWLFTFGFGLVWVLAFLLPTEVGGGIDRHGMYAPDLLGTRLYYTTGVRAAPQPLTEHTIGAHIVSMDLRDTSVRIPCFSSSITRRDDYYGAKRPQVYQDRTGYHMLYIGLGYDGKNRVCMADSSDGVHFNPRNESVFEVAGATNIEYISLSRDKQRLSYIVLKEGRRVVQFAQFTDTWQPDGGLNEDPNSVLSVTDRPNDDGAYSLSIEPSGTPRVTDLIVSDSGMPENKDSVVSEWVGARFADIVDVRLTKDGNKMRALVVGGSADGLLRTAVFEGPTLHELKLAAGAQSDGSVASLGTPAQTTYFNDWAGTLADFVAIVSAFGFGMGLISLVAIHGKRVRKGGELAPYSGIVLVAVAAMLVVQLVFATTKPESGIWVDLNQLLFYRLQFPLGSTMFGLLAAYLVSAAYRAFRIRSFDATVLALMAAFVMLTQVPTAQFLASIFAPGLVEKGAQLDQAAVEGRTWMLGLANDAVQRAVGFGAFIGAIAMAMRIWLSLDRTARE